MCQRSLFYSSNLSRVGAYGDISLKFTTRCGVRQSGPLPRFLFSFATTMAMEIGPFLCEDSDIDICSDRSLPGLE